MKANRFIVGLLLLMASLVMAQDMRWQSMDGPYYVYDVTGISLGWDGTQMRAYMVASDLTDRYIYYYNGSSPINGWVRPVDPIISVKYVCASRQNGLMAYATIPEQEGIAGTVLYTSNGGVDWFPTPSQPGNKAFTCIETHPTNPEICFTGGENNATYASVSRTTDGGDSWSEIGLNNLQIDPRYKSYSVKIDPNSGSSINNTTIYVRYDFAQAIWRNTQGGNGAWEVLPLPDAGTNYNGIDIAIKEGNSDCIYLISEYDGEYKLWHSTNGGQNWIDPIGEEAPFRNFGATAINKVIIAEYNGYDVLWVLSPDTFHIYAGWMTSLLPVARWIDQSIINGRVQCAALDPSTITVNKPCGDLYIGTEYSIQKVYYQSEAGGYSLHSEGKEKGTNITEGASLDYLSNIYVLSKSGGYISEYKHAEDATAFWKNVDNFMIHTGGPADIQTLGKKVATYINQGQDYMAALGANSTGNQLILSRHGFMTYTGTNHFNTIVGPYASIFSNVGPFLAGYKTDPMVGWSWEFNNGTFYDFYSFGSNLRQINDMQFGRNTSGLPDAYVCGSRISPSEYLAAYSNSENNTIHLNDGLSSTNNAYSILPTREKDEIENIYYQSLYLGTDDGIYKNYFDGISPTAWRKVLNTNSNLDVIDLADFNRLATQPPTYDSIVHFALAKDRTTGDPYIYVTADSGRSWVEIGESLRNQALRVNDLTMYYDPIGENEHPCYLAAGTNRGVYKIAYNVKSGTVTQNDTWGPGLVIVNGDITIPAGVTLTIAAGTTVKFVYGFDRLAGGNDIQKSEILVYGTLNLDGEDNNHVILTSSKATPSYGDWYGIWVMNNGSLEMKYTDLDYAVTAVTAEQGSNTNIRYSQGDVPKIGHTRDS